MSFNYSHFTVRRGLIVIQFPFIFLSPISTLFFRHYPPHSFTLTLFTTPFYHLPSMIAFLHQWNASVFSLFGLCLNPLLIWLVLFRSPNEMHSYSRILLQTAIVDLALAVLNALTQPILFTFDNATIIFLNGPIRAIHSINARFTVLILWIFLISFAIHGLCLQFLIRYLQLVKDFRVTLSRYLLLLLIPASLISVFCALFFIAGHPQPSTSDHIISDQISRLLTVPTAPIVFITVNAVSSDTGHITSVFGLLLSALCYSVIIFCGSRSVKFVRLNAMPKGPWNQLQRARFVDMNSQITRSLIILAIMPLLLVFLHALLALFSVYYAEHASGGSGAVLYFELLSTLFTHWLPVLNPLATIFTVKPFWATVVSRLKKRRVMPGGNDTEQQQTSENNVARGQENR